MDPIKLKHRPNTTMRVYELWIGGATLYIALEQVVAIHDGDGRFRLTRSSYDKARTKHYDALGINAFTECTLDELRSRVLQAMAKVVREEITEKLTQ